MQRKLLQAKSTQQRQQKDDSYRISPGGDREVTVCLVKKGETVLKVLLKTVEQTANVKAKHRLEKKMRGKFGFSKTERSSYEQKR